MMNNIYRGYALMRFRMKISYHAFIKSMTIKEHFFMAILKAYQCREAKDLIQNPWPKMNNDLIGELKTSNLLEICCDHKDHGKQE